MELNVRGDQISYLYRKGEENGATVIFIHGSTMCADSMEVFFDDLPQYTCISVDLPGHGRSGGGGCVSAGDYTDYIVEFLEQLRMQNRIDGKTVIAGFSLGGCIALELAIRETQGVDGLIILDSGADLTENSPLLGSVRSLTPDALDLEALFSNCFGTITTDEFRGDMMKQLLDGSPSKEVSYHDLIAAQSYQRPQDCRNISVPVLAVNGDEDNVVPAQCAIHLWESIPDCTLTILPFVGHGGIFEYKDFLTGVMSNFITHKVTV